MSVRILLADDHELLRQGLRRILESGSGFLVVGEAATGREAVTLAEALRPDVAVIDIAMPDGNGFEATTGIGARSPATAVLIASMHGDERYVVRALKAGARGYILKDSLSEELPLAVQCIADGSLYFSPAIASTMRDCGIWPGGGAGRRKPS